MKKLSSLFLLALLPLMASAYDAQVKGIFYNLNRSTKQATVTFGNTRYTGKKTIPATVTSGGVTYRVTSIGDSAFEACFGLTSVIIPNSVTRIGDWSFFFCSSLKSVKIPNSVKSIGTGAFWGCSLTSVTIPKSVTSIGKEAFLNCLGLKSIVVESGNTKYEARDSCDAIIETATNTVIASCNKTEGKSVRYKVNLQQSVIFPMGKIIIHRSQEENVEKVAKYAKNFKNCKILVQGFAYEPDCGAKTQKEWEAIQYKISEMRAKSVKKMLVEKYLIDADRIIAKGCGFTTKLFEEVEFNRVVLFHAIPE